MTTEKPLPFVYQFAAGAVAGVSEVSYLGNNITWMCPVANNPLQILVMYLLVPSYLAALPAGLTNCN